MSMNWNRLINIYVTETHIPEVEGDLQVVPEMFCKLRIHIKNLQNIFSKYFVEVTVGQSPHIRVGFSWSGIQVDRLTKNVVLPWKKGNCLLTDNSVTDTLSYTTVNSINYKKQL